MTSESDRRITTALKAAREEVLRCIDEKQVSDHYEYEKVEALRESTTPQDSKKVRNDQTFHKVLEESVNKSSGVSKTAHADSMAGPVKQRNGFSILEHFQEFIDIGQAMGYKMKGAWESEEKAAGKETLSFESGTWMANNADLLFIFVYSPQELSLKRVIWNYMLETLNRWHGEVIIMGDFNESSIKSRNKDHDRKVIQDSLIEIDLRLDKRNGLPDDLTKSVNLFRDLKDIDHKDSIDLAPKAKIKWAVEGGENSKFFHGIVNKKRRHLAIKGILVDGEWIENPNRVKSEFYSYYSNLFSAPAWDRSLFDVNFPSLVIGDIVSQEQSAFIKGRQLMDGPPILNEIRGCLQSSKASVLVNGSPTDEFSFHRGLGQEDPLSPFLFILVMESLHVSFQRLIDRASSSSLWINVIKSIHGNSGALEYPYSSRLKNSTWIGILKAINKLKEKFKRLFNLELQKDANVASKLQASNVASSFRRPSRSDSPSVSHGTTSKVVVQSDLTNLPEKSRKFLRL
nr:hypothetical protein [Tanacetum cinerariifolium]